MRIGHLWIDQAPLTISFWVISIAVIARGRSHSELLEHRMVPSHLRRGEEHPPRMQCMYRYVRCSTTVAFGSRNRSNTYSRRTW